MKKLSPQAVRQVIVCLKQGVSCKVVATRISVSASNISRISTVVVDIGKPPVELLKLSDGELYAAIYLSAPSSTDHGFSSPRCRTAP